MSIDAHRMEPANRLAADFFAGDHQVEPGALLESGKDYSLNPPEGSGSESMHSVESGSSFRCHSPARSGGVTSPGGTFRQWKPLETFDLDAESPPPQLESTAETPRGARAARRESQQSLEMSPGNMIHPTPSPLGRGPSVPTSASGVGRRVSPRLAAAQLSQRASPGLGAPAGPQGTPKPQLPPSTVKQGASASGSRAKRRAPPPADPFDTGRDSKGVKVSGPTAHSFASVLILILRLEQYTLGLAASLAVLWLLSLDISIPILQEAPGWLLMILLRCVDININEHFISAPMIYYLRDLQLETAGAARGQPGALLRRALEAPAAKGAIEMAKVVVTGLKTAEADSEAATYARHKEDLAERAELTACMREVIGLHCIRMQQAGDSQICISACLFLICI